MASFPDSHFEEEPVQLNYPRLGGVGTRSSQVYSCRECGALVLAHNTETHYHHHTQEELWKEGHESH